MKSIVILSGGMDSTVLAYHTAAHPNKTLAGCVSVNYGQRHSRELQCAARTCKHLGVQHFLLDLSGLARHLNNSALTCGWGSIPGDPGFVPVPHGHYGEESMKATVVPNRNMILIALAVGIAVNNGAQEVAYGAHAGDHAIYPDCRPEFASALSTAVDLCDYDPPHLIRPFIELSKADIVTLGLGLGVRFEDTHTCYEGEAVACGRCGTCVERLEAFSIASAVDPLPYRDRTYWSSVVAAKPVAKLI